MPQKLYPNFHRCFASHHVDKFVKVTPIWIQSYSL